MFITVNGDSGTGKSTLVNRLRNTLGCDYIDIRRQLIPYSYLDFLYRHICDEMFRAFHGTGYMYQMFKETDYVIFEQFLWPFYIVWQQNQSRYELDFFCSFYEKEMAETVHFWLELDNRERYRRKGDRAVGNIVDVVRPELPRDQRRDAAAIRWIRFVSEVVPNFHVLDMTAPAADVEQQVLDVIGYPGGSYVHLS